MRRGNSHLSVATTPNGCVIILTCVTEQGMVLLEKWFLQIVSFSARMICLLLLSWRAAAGSAVITRIEKVLSPRLERHRQGYKDAQSASLLPSQLFGIVSQAQMR